MFLTKAFCRMYLQTNVYCYLGDVRNDIYITIEKGEFERGSGKTAQRNVEVTMVVLAGSGRIIEDCIYVGGGSKALSEYRSIIYYHNGNPKWYETIKVGTVLLYYNYTILA